MTDTISDKLTRLNEVKQQIKQSIINKGVQVADTDPFSAYPAKIGQISGGGGTTTKYGASVDTWIGDVDENGVLQRATWTGALNFAGVKEIVAYGLKYTFYACLGITSVDLSSVQKIGIEGMNSAFRDCVGITSVDLSSLQTVDVTGLNDAFNGCKGITSVDLSSLQFVYANGLSNAFRDCVGITSVVLSSLHEVNLSGLSRAFYGCTGLTSVDFSSSQHIGSKGLQSAFDGCTSLTSISFPSLTDVQTNSFGSSTLNGTFRNCTALTEIHFRADMQATIEAMQGYGEKWGATNCTIYFDLIGTITVNGVAYSRNEPNSIRVDGTKTFVAWKDASNNIVYTNATAEPAVGTPVYSDAGTTQVGTVSGVA